jgi:hypothetical protein
MPVQAHILADIPWIPERVEAMFGPLSFLGNDNRGACRNLSRPVCELNANAVCAKREEARMTRR